MTRRQIGVVLAVIFAIGTSVHSRDIAGLVESGRDVVSFGGGGGSLPLPPKPALTPTLGKPSPNGRLTLLQVVSAARRTVVLRDGCGGLLGVGVTDGRGRMVLAVPAEGALLDVLGTDVIGLPVRAGQEIRVLAGGVMADQD